MQFVHYMAKKMSEKVNDTHEIYVYVDFDLFDWLNRRKLTIQQNACRLNFRPASLMMNGTVDLVKEDIWDWPYHWIINNPPLTEEEQLYLPWNWSFVCLYFYFLIVKINHVINHGEFQLVAKSVGK